MPLQDGDYPIPGCNIARGDVVTIENAKILWPNFSGAKDQYNAEGDRNFNLHLSKQQADELAADGWNVKCKPARPDDEDGEERCVLQVGVKFDILPPKIVGIGSLTRARTEYHEGIAGLLDSAEFKTVDVSIRPYFWHIKATDAIGVKAYLKTMYAVINEDELDMKWLQSEEDNG